MSNGTTYNSHVYMMYRLPEDPSKPGDTFLGTILILCSALGIPGNLLSLSYFLHTKNVKNVSALLYKAICLVDLTTSVFTLPAAHVLFTARRPGLFNNYTFCVTWVVIYEYLQVMSIFLVMLISVTRSVSIVSPARKIPARAVLLAIILYTLLILTERVLGTHQALKYSYAFSPDDPNCWGISEFQGQWPFFLQATLYALRVGLPSIITFLSFVVSCWKLATMKKVGEGASFKRASVTIAWFTGIFLACNLPFFVNVSLLSITVFAGFPIPGELAAVRVCQRKKLNCIS